MKKLIHTIFEAKYAHIYWYVLLFLLLSVTFFLRMINLNYNTAFTDEASSIVVGRLGMFQGDWWTYNAQSWMSGSPVINPVLSALSYFSGGLWGSRLVSVIFGTLTVETIVVLTILLNPPFTLRSYFSGIIAGIIVAVAPISLFIGRLSTYDIKSFYFLFLSLTILVWTETSKKNLGKWYFVGFITLFLALLAKIIALIYIPLFIIYSFAKVRNDPERKFFWIRYFFFPTAIVVSIYLLNTLYYMLAFAGLQASKDTYNTWVIVQRIYAGIKYELWLGAIGSVILILKGYWKKVLLLSFAGIWVLGAHLVTGRALWTMDKQEFITLAFLAILAGIGISHLIFSFKSKWFTIALSIMLFANLVFYAIDDYTESIRYDTYWKNTYQISAYLEKTVNSGDKVLTETGSPLILALYNRDFPSNITTFDYFSYQKLEGNKAYRAAVNDGYFDWIELTIEKQAKLPTSVILHKEIKDNLNGNYKLVYKDELNYVYKRLF